MQKPLGREGRMEKKAKAKLTATIMDALNQGLSMDDIKKLFKAYSDIKRVRMDRKRK